MVGLQIILIPYSEFFRLSIFAWNSSIDCKYALCRLREFCMAPGSPARTSRALLKGAVIAAALAVMAPATAQATVSTVPDDTAKVAGGVYGMALANGKTYIGGQFTKVGGKTRANVAAINNADGKVDLTFNPGRTVASAPSPPRRTAA